MRTGQAKEEPKNFWLQANRSEGDQKCLNTRAGEPGWEQSRPGRQRDSGAEHDEGKDGSEGFRASHSSTSSGIHLSASWLKLLACG